MCLCQNSPDNLSRFLLPFYLNSERKPEMQCRRRCLYIFFTFLVTKAGGHRVVEFWYVLIISRILNRKAAKVSYCVSFIDQTSFPNYYAINNYLTWHFCYGPTYINNSSPQINLLDYYIFNNNNILGLKGFEPILYSY